ncbi:MAG TPA: DUF1653 domain-containing protein [Candidatus Paceibacterota bacterium]|nr:DUF1653 domain-containing protein [Candidatus Paceibacterota bacterium]
MNENAPQIPQTGFYYHFKHDPEVSIDNYAYEVIGIARHTETNELLVVYRPIYESTSLAPADCSVRPLAMFMDTVDRGKGPTKRFTEITDEDIIVALEEIRDGRE